MINSIDLKFYGSVARKAIFRFVIVIGIGWGFSIVCLIVSGFLFDTDDKPGYAGANAGIVGAILAIFYLFITDFWAALLMVSSLLFMSLYFVAAKRLAVQVAVNGMWSNNLQASLVHKIEAYLQKIDSLQSGWLKRVGKPSEVVERLVEFAKKDNSSHWTQRMVMNRLLKRVKLNDVNIYDSKIDLAKVFVMKIEERMGTYAKPSFRFFLIVLFTQLVLLALTVIL